MMADFGAALEGRRSHGDFDARLEGKPKSRDEHPIIQTLRGAGHGDLLALNRNKPRQKASGTTALINPADRDQRYALATLEQLGGEVATAIEGTRNHTLNANALRAYRVADGCGLGRQIVTDHMTEAADRCGLDYSEIAGTLRSAQDGATKHGPAHRDADWDPTPLGNSTFVPDELQERFVRGSAFILDIPETVPAIWGDGKDILWAEGESLMIAGPMGLGKTTLGGMLMRAQLGIGPAEVLGLPVKRSRGKILYLAMDRPAQAARALARQFTPSDREVLDERLLVWKGPPPADVGKHPDQLALLAEKAGAEVVYLDSVKDAAIGLSEDEVGAGYNRARQKLIASGRQLCELHHTTKRGANGGPPKDVSDIYGSTWITNGTGSIILLNGAPGDPIVGFRHVRQPIDEVGPWQLLHDQDAGEITVHHELDLLALVRSMGADGLTAAQAATCINGPDPDDPKKAAPTRGEVEKARRKLATLEQDGVLRCIKGQAGGDTKKPAVWFLNEAVTL